MHRFAAAFLALALAPAAHASQQGVIVLKKWKQMDVCTQKAQEAFPDHTSEGNAKREAKLRECLAGQNLPPREPLAAPR